MKNSLSISINDTFLWSDSIIALHWINTSPHCLQTFVANRVAEIQRLTNFCHWRHVPSADNPADLVSRGQLPHEFSHGKIRQDGPSWLSKNKYNWPNTILTPMELPDVKQATKLKLTCMKVELRGIDLLEKYSFEKFKHILAHIFRFF